MPKKKINPILFLLWIIFVVFPTIKYSIDITQNNLDQTSQVILLFNFFIYGSFAWADL